MREEEIFHGARALRGLERAAFLDHECRGDAVLRASVEALLNAFDAAGGFLEKNSARRSASDPSESDARPGAIVGPYRLLEQIGEGGMGSVFRAEQTEPVKRTVALKVIKPGMDSSQVVARFEAERQALALMDHPNIAKVLDAGVTDRGHPFFAMEHVAGVPITQYCDDAKLPIKERLRLLIAVCHAIQHAHQKGIIHRDVKPTNVLVTLYDGKPVPKVIDFGVAKATERELTERTLGTQFGTVIGTLEYMSPEQSELSHAGIDTRSDVYSLGVLLYELLTGTTPLERNRVLELGYVESVRHIKETDPPAPSSRLSDSGEAISAISASRQVEPRKLSKLVSGELDWITMKCLEKDRDRRYESAAALAADLIRFIADEPIQAGPPSRTYRLRKFIRRNRRTLAPAGLLGVVTLAVCIASGVILWRAYQAETTARVRATANMHVALSAIRGLYGDMTANWFADDGQDHAWKRDFLQGMLGVYREFLEHNQDALAPKHEMARVYGEVAIIQLGLGEFAQATEANEMSLKLLEPLLNAEPNDPDYRRSYYIDIHTQGRLLAIAGRQQEAIDRFRQSISLRESLANDYPEQPQYAHDALTGRMNLCKHLEEEGRFDEFEEQSRTAVERADALVKSFGPTLEIRQIQAGAWLNLATSLSKRRQWLEAVEWYRRSADLRRSLAVENPTRLGCQFELATVLNDLANVQESAELLKPAMETRIEHQSVVANLLLRSPANPKFRRELATSHYNLAILFQHLKKSKEGEEQYKRSQELLDRLLADFPNDFEAKSQLGTTLNNLAVIAEDRGDVNRAKQMFERAVELQRAAVQANPRHAEYRDYLAKHYLCLLQLCLNTSNRADALRWADEMAKLNPTSVKLLGELAVVFACINNEQLRDPARAAEWAKRAIAFRPQDADLRNTLGVAHYRNGEFTAAVEALNEAVRLGNGGNGVNWYLLAMAQWKLGAREEAGKWFAKANEWREKSAAKDEGVRLLHAEAAQVLEIKVDAPLPKVQAPAAALPNHSAKLGAAKP